VFYLFIKEAGGSVGIPPHPPFLKRRLVSRFLVNRRLVCLLRRLDLFFASFAQLLIKLKLENDL
jgi:hypothetical protein